MTYTKFLQPRKEIVSGEGIEGIIDLANIGNKRKIEGQPPAFFDLTYPTADIRRVLEDLDKRFTQQGADSPGSYLLEGEKGCGKSHLLLLIYHLFKHHEAAEPWLAKHQISCGLPDDCVVVLNKFTDKPLISVWDFVFEQLTGTFRGESQLQPDLEEMQQVLGSRRLVLVLDELEQGIRILPNKALQYQNIMFLQMLSEWANRTDQVTIFSSIYSVREEPGKTLKRVPAVRAQFRSKVDRARVVLHRIFKNFLDFDPKAASPAIDSFINIWRRHLEFNADEYRSRMRESYPFSPDLLDVVLERVPARGGFQNVRGALGFLAHLVYLTHEHADLITPSHASILDHEVATRLSDLDPSGQLIGLAQGNLEELKEWPLAYEIASTILLYTLAGVAGRNLGASREEIARSVMKPGTDINDLEGTLLAFEKYASHLHKPAERYLFDLEENEQAKVEFYSLRISSGRAQARLRELWSQDLFRGSNSLVFSELDETRMALEELEKDRLRFVLAPRRLSREERHSLYHGLSLRNQVILLEPKDDTFNLDSHPDLLKWAKREIAARDLAGLAGNASRRESYQGIAGDERREILATLRRAGLIYVRFEKHAATPEEDIVEEESLGTASSSEDIHRVLSQDFYPAQLLAEHIGPRLAQLKGRTVGEVDREYRATLGFPVPTHAPSVSKAIRQLCRERKLGLRHSRGHFCGEDPSLTETELFSATLDDPFEIPPPPTPIVPEEVVRLEVVARGVSTLEPGQEVRLSARGVASDGSILDNLPVSWSSSSPDIVSVDPEGRATAKSTGRAEIVVVLALSEGRTIQSEPHAVTVIERSEQVDMPIAPRSSGGALREEIATRMQEYEGARISEVRFTIFFDQRTGDLSSLPATFRGSLSGEGQVTAEITIRQEGHFSKGEVEAMAERLPSIPNAEYSARLSIHVPVSSEEGDGG